ncbi:MAG: polysaccharide pyruvyl transferase family protein [Defluviitaleaceae bacterium]|nr:polysaccharide pyruvyl transferase family protein [Defluviitaleaceae bacterium]
MTVCIVTIYRNGNPGSAFQAYALQKVLSENNDVFFHKYISPGLKKRKLFLSVSSSLIRLNFSGAARKIYRYHKFIKFIQRFKELSANDLSEVDCFVLGSDIIWDLEAKRENAQIFWGTPFKGKKIISYAACAANTTPEMLAENGITTGSLEHIKSISVRDEHTKNLIAPLVSIPITMVCDPALLLSADDYEEFNTVTPVSERYILIYMFKTLTETAKNELFAFAKKTNRKIISFTTSAAKLGEIKIPQEPWSFISYYKNADFVITDTFHGSIFSIIMQRQFITIQRGKNKVTDLLNSLHLNQRLAEDNAGIISSLEKSIDWTQPNDALANIRAHSLKYLKDALQ